GGYPPEADPRSRLRSCQLQRRERESSRGAAEIERRHLAWPLGHLRLRPYLFHQRYRAPQRLEPLVERAAVRLKAQRRHARVPVLADALADHVPGAEQVRLEDQLVGHERGRAFPVAFDPALLDGDRL